MRSYILRRLVQLIPTLLGIVLVTFVLFNMVGGSAASMSLGEKASAKALEDFDEQRGYNKPLFFGRRIETRAFADDEFERNAGAWGKSGAIASGSGTIKLPPGTHPIPLAFNLRKDISYEWIVRVRANDSAALRIGSAHESVYADWKKLRLPNDSTAPVLEALGNEIEIDSIQLRRKVANPFDSQLWFFIRQLARLDLGTSNSTQQPVSAMLRSGIGPTLVLTVPILVIETLLAVVLALLCAYFRDRLADRLVVLVSVGLMSVNYLVWIVAAQYWLGFRWQWFPVWGFESWTYLLLPILVGVTGGVGSSVRFYRAVMVDQMERDYVRTARAKGLGPARILFRHVLPNASIQIITSVVLALPFLYTGSLLLESFFGIPGLGYLSVNALNSSDVDVVRAVVVLGSVLYLFANLLADILYAWADPRVRLS